MATTSIPASAVGNAKLDDRGMLDRFDRCMEGRKRVASGLWL